MGFQVILPRKVLKTEITQTKNMPQIIGWRHYPKFHEGIWKGAAKNSAERNPMETVFLMTWNTALYREDTPICNKYKEVVRVVKGHLENSNAICFLQEVPYHSNKTWQEHIIYTAIKKEFSAEKYEVFFNISSKNQIMMTVAMAKKGILTKSDCVAFNTNRTVTVKYKDRDFEITGIHAQNGKMNKSYLESLDTCDSDIVLGDFNAGDYEESENRDLFNHILKNHVCICNDITRWVGSRPTAIDHVFVNTSKIRKYAACVVHGGIRYSDHYPITFNVELE